MDQSRHLSIPDVTRIDVLREKKKTDNAVVKYIRKIFWPGYILYMAWQLYQYMKLCNDNT